ncbi:hypothetical protein DSO57_1035781 [Entomophthora muscae]|uniref:Uncharacterized protein n=1 Tax=Entomophthora muscae TaxID=34485 RepID=A0ACC2U9J4_9FUNG|nr:hypothetical protein DSO57_1035781 [Entomophthora muscae]
MVLTRGTTSPSFTPFDTAFIGPTCPLSAGSTSPTISSPLLEEDISYPPTILSAVVIFPQPHISPISMDTPTFDQVKETVLALMQGFYATGTMSSKLKPTFGSPDYCFMIVEQGLANFHTSSLAATVNFLQHFVQPALFHYQLLLDLHSFQLNAMLTASHNNYKQFVAFFQGFNLWGVPENLRADGPRAQQGEPTTRLGLALQYKITIF